MVRCHTCSDHGQVDTPDGPVVCPNSDCPLGWQRKATHLFWTLVIVCALGVLICLLAP